jgi:hypothetical protein
MKHLDDIYRNAFEQFEADPPQEAWEAVEQHLDKKKKRRFFYWQWSVVASTLLVGILAYWATKEDISLANSEKSNEKVALSAENQMKTPEIAVDKVVATSSVNIPFWEKRNKKTSHDKAFENSIFIKNKESEKSISEENTKVSTDEVAYKPLKNKRDSIGALPLLNNQKFESDQKATTHTDCFEFTKKKKHSQAFFVDAYFGYDYVRKTLAMTDGEPSKLLANRLESESFVIAYSGGIRGGFRKAHLGGLLGVEMNHLVEKVEHVDSRSERLNIEINKVTDALGNVIRLDTVTKKTIGKEISTHYNRFTTINIPIQASYHWHIKRWDISANAGPMLNLRFFKSGFIVNEKEKLVAFGNDSPIFKQHLKINWLGSITVAHQLTNHWSIFGEPTFLYQPKPITQPTYALSQRYARAGLYVGMRYSW